MQDDCQNSDSIRSAPSLDIPECASSGDYATRLAAEVSIYEECVDVHALPPIFTYWSERYLRPLFSQFGFGSSIEMFANYLEKKCAASSGTSRFISLGSGNCFMEVALASQLMSKGYSRFSIECFDLNSKMLERGRTAAEKAGVIERMHFQQGDLNTWTPQHEYDAIIADQSLHHVLYLETLFDRVKEALATGGSFLVSDMIGRNGHQRWPEALTLVHKFWRKLPPSYRYNQTLKRYEELYENWDCSREGFEGIRSQDILPCLLQRFSFHLFLGFGNIIDPFIDRAFGPNFDAAVSWDRWFIDQVHLRDQQCLLSGCIKPTHMLAVVGKNAAGPPLVHQFLTPEFCVRATGQGDTERISRNQEGTPAMLADSYDWNAWLHNPQRELKAACRMLKEQGQRVWELEKEFEERTAWALRLDEELKTRDKQLLELQQCLNNPLRSTMHWLLTAHKRAKR